MTLAEAARDFLAQKRIAIVGVSRNSSEAANFIFRRLRDTGHDVIPVNPRAPKLEDTKCYATLSAVPGTIDAVVVCTPPAATADIVRDCANRGITRVWLHRALGSGSVSKDALSIAQENHLTLIPGACPAMFCNPVDLGHRCMRWVLNVAGRLPQDVDEETGSAEPQN